jgi:hypothetical protein
MENQLSKLPPHDGIFSGNIYIFHAFDIGDDINLSAIQRMNTLAIIDQKIPKYFKEYHVPLTIELKNTKNHTVSSCKLHNFGALSLTYKIPFKNSFKDLRKTCTNLMELYNEKSAQDALEIFNTIQTAIMQPAFAKAHSFYLMLQIDPHSSIAEPSVLQKSHGEAIATILRLETETLSEHQISEIWDSAIGYFRGELMVIDTDASLIYTDDYEDIINLFEFVNVQQLELRYFDRTLDQKLNEIYDGTVQQTTWHSYVPFYTMFGDDPIERLWKMKVDISVITERLESSIKIANEPYLSDLYNLLNEHIDIKGWKDSIERKLKIIESVQTSHQHKIETNREDMISILITLLIFIELVIGVLNYFGK